MMVARDKAIDKIRKLLMLARSANEHEAANAAAQAARLMAQHGIDSVSEMEPDVDPVGDNRDLHVEIGSGRRPVGWKWRLAWCVADNARCKPCLLDRTLDDGTYMGKSVCFLGRRSDAELCSFLFSYMLRELKRLHDIRRPRPGDRVQRYVPGQAPPVVDKEYLRHWSRNFYLGATTVIAARMSGATQEVMRTAVVCRSVQLRDPDLVRG